MQKRKLTHLYWEWFSIFLVEDLISLPFLLHVRRLNSLHLLQLLPISSLKKKEKNLLCVDSAEEGLWSDAHLVLVAQRARQRLGGGRKVEH